MKDTKAHLRSVVREAFEEFSSNLQDEIASAKFRGVTRDDVNCVLARGGDDDHLAAEISILKRMLGERDHIREGGMSANGDCYEAAGKFMMMKCQFGDNCDNLTLVHGEVMGQGHLEGITYGHAWVLDDTGNVIDKSNGRDLVLPKPIYYAVGQIDNIGNVHEYTWPQVKKLILTNEHWGPWDLETATGY